MTDLTLLLWLLPGLIGALIGLGWLYWRGGWHGLPEWSLAGLLAIGLLGLLFIARGWLTGGFLLMGLVFAGLAALSLWLIRQKNNQDDEIACLRKLAEEPSERINILSHSIHTPLTIIKGRLEQLSDGHPGPLTALQAEFLQAAYQECEKLIALAKDLLMQAPIGAGIFNLRP